MPAAPTVTLYLHTLDGFPGGADMQGAIRPSPGDALIVVDVQNDFLPGGSLAVPHGDEVVPVLNRYMAAFRDAEQPIYLTRDWHPENHCSFEARGGIWPAHCVPGTPGAEFAPGLARPPDAVIVSKGTSRDEDAYSGFQGTDLDARLRARGVERLFIGGLATDYCVLNTVRDAIANGFTVLLLQDAIRAVNALPGDGAKAEREMLELGATPIRLEAMSA